MRRPVIGIIGNSHLINDEYPAHAGGTMNSEAISQVSGGIPLLVPADPALVSVNELLDVCDGFLLTGGRPNVHPEEYGEAETPAHGAFDRARDAITLPLVRACVERGQPFLGVCRGFQEVNVAMGGTLYPEIRDLPGRMNHRMPPRWHAGREIRPAPCRALYRRRRVPPPDGRTGSDDQHAARPRGETRRRAHCHRRPRARWHARGAVCGRCAGLYAVGAMAPRMARGR